MSDRTIGILGLGIFGSSVLTALAKQDMNIIAIDDHAEHINQFEPVLARAVRTLLPKIPKPKIPIVRSDIVLPFSSNTNICFHILNQIFLIRLVIR